jgi:hypothetical protein
VTARSAVASTLPPQHWTFQTTEDESFFVMAGLDPAIHVFLAYCKEDVDARHKAGHDELCRRCLILLAAF